MFRRNGFDVATASTAAEGLISIASHRNDVTVQGLVCRDLPGLELVKQLKARARTVRIVALSEFPDGANLEPIRAERFALVVMKPCRPDDLLRHVVQLISGPRPRRRKGVKRV